MCCNVYEVSAEIVIVYFCTIFYGVGDMLSKIGHLYRQADAKIASYVESYKHTINIWAISSGVYLQNKINAWDFIIDSSMRSHMITGYR